MCLPLNPYKIEREWKHAGLSCAVVQAREAAHRCGYVRVPPGHPLHGINAEDAGVGAHGGLNFAEIEPCTEHEDGQGWWFGFDCAHFMDARFDPNVDLEQVSALTRERIAIERMLTGFPSEHYWTQPEVEAETERLAEQFGYRRMIV